MKTRLHEELLEYIEEGQRSERLKRSMSDCPDFENPLFRKAWKAGFYSSLHKVSAQAALETLKKEIAS